MKVSINFRTEDELTYTAHLLGISTLLAKLNTGSLLTAEAFQVEEDIRLRLTQLAKFKYDDVIDEAVQLVARVEDLIAMSFLQGFKFDVFLEAMVDIGPLKEMRPEVRLIIGKFYNRNVLPPISAKLLFERDWKSADKWYFLACFKPDGGFPLNVGKEVIDTIHPTGMALLFS